MSDRPVKVAWNGDELSPSSLAAAAWDVSDDALVYPPRTNVLDTSGGEFQRDVAFDPGDGVYAFSPGLAQKGSFAAKLYLPRTKAWGAGIAEDATGDIVESPSLPLPLYTKRRYGRHDLGLVRLDVGRYARRAGLGTADAVNVRCEWTGTRYTGGTTYIPVPEGDVAVVCAGVNADKLWEPSKLMGIVGPEGAELLPYHAGMPRIDLRKALAATTAEAAIAAFDVNPEPKYRESRYYQNTMQWTESEPSVHPQYLSPPNGRTDEQLDTSALRVRIVRSRINNNYYPGSSSWVSPKNVVVFDGVYDLDVQDTLTEKDLFARGLPDLDFDQFTDEPYAIAVFGKYWITSVVYRIVFGNGSVNWADQCNNFPVMFVNAYEVGLSQTPAVHVSPASSDTTAATPTFRWTHANTIGKAYPAFRLRIWESADTFTDATNVYDSGVLLAPPRDADGVYEFTLPAASALPSGTYSWAVSMLDAKFSVPGEDETHTTFVVA